MTERTGTAITETPVQPLPPEVTEHPAWRAIWQKLLGPTPDELDTGRSDTGDDADRDVA